MPIPGAFDMTLQRDRGATPRLSGAKSHIFHPPRAHSDSASSSMILTRSTTSIISTSTANTSTSRTGWVGPRKRSRAEAGNETPPREEEWPASMVNSSEAAGADLRPGSPMPFVNTKYVLAGGMDTPTLKAAQLAIGGVGEYSDVGYRKSLGEDGMNSTRRTLFVDGEEGPGYFSADDLGRDANGRGRGWNSPAGEGWSKAAIHVAGAVVGKVWEFCKNSGAVFRGFHAGGGEGYTISNTGGIPLYSGEQNDNLWETEKTSAWGPPDRGSTPLPGRFPEEDFIPDYLDRPAPDSDPRPAKRRQVSKNSQDEIAKNWVVVPPPTTPSTPSKAQPRGAARYSMPTASSASRRSTATATASRPASRAGFGPSAAPRRPMLARISHAGSPALNPSRGASFASPRSSPGSKIPRASPKRDVTSPEKKVLDSPAAKEAQRWAALKKKEEREADESIRRLDRQLKAMIREGKEALGTRIEVDMEDDVALGRSGLGNKKRAV
ncbi:uncharacterized protein BP5553_03236 [Venustampulla echinocandica]|uniref:Uncharacterized protein n=1 Tax=Venustampulla echinocandica TaxID=2656787 RepID=A0A370TTP0_9HELO|nr:uncharacterized protein BP5553_03236 [Venustampulla echinocandica]RDL38896.1 hypothetical protein BP5553_03236 [Venustampulla echinocandica]